jgi:hypothetical protein
MIQTIENNTEIPPCFHFVTIVCPNLQTFYFILNLFQTTINIPQDADFIERTNIFSEISNKKEPSNYFKIFFMTQITNLTILKFNENTFQIEFTYFDKIVHSNQYKMCRVYKSLFDNYSIISIAYLKPISSITQYYKIMVLNYASLFHQVIHFVDLPLNSSYYPEIDNYNFGDDYKLKLFVVSFLDK